MELCIAENEWNFDIQYFGHVVRVATAMLENWSHIEGFGLTRSRVSVKFMSVNTTPPSYTLFATVNRTRLVRCGGRIIA